MTRVRSIVAGLALALIVAAPTLGTTATGTRNATVTIISSITMTGVVATLPFSTTALSNDVLTEAAPMAVTTRSDAVNGYRIVVAQNALTGSGTALGATIPLTAWSFKVVDSFGVTKPSDLVIPAANNNLFGVNAGSFAPVTCGPICETTGADQTWQFTERLTIPAWQKIGPYAGTVIYTAATLD